MTEFFGALQTYPDDEGVLADTDPRTNGRRYWTSAEIASDCWFLVECHGEPGAPHRPMGQMWITVCAEQAVELARQSGLGRASLMACLPAPDDNTERTFLFGEVEEILVAQTNARQIIRFRDGRTFWVERPDESSGRHSTSLRRLYVAPPGKPASLISAPPSPIGHT